MRQELRRFRAAILLILAFTLGLGAQLLQAQVSVSPSRSRFGATIAPSTNDGAALGTTTLGWSDLHLATGGVINWANGEVTITETDANTLTLAGGDLLLPDATGWRVTSENSGMHLSGTSLGIRLQGTSVYHLFSTTYHRLNNAGMYLDINGDTFWGREAAAIWQAGLDSATPIAQTIKGPDARDGTDTDTVGGNITFAAGRGTGTGNPGAIFFQTGATNAPGTAAGPLTTRLEVASTGRLIIASHTRFNVASSTTGTGTALLGTNAPIGQVAAPFVWLAVIASDGTAIWVPAWR